MRCYGRFYTTEKRRGNTTKILCSRSSGSCIWKNREVYSLLRQLPNDWFSSWKLLCTYSGGSARDFHTVLYSPDVVHFLYPASGTAIFLSLIIVGGMEKRNSQILTSYFEKLRSERKRKGRNRFVFLQEIWYNSEETVCGQKKDR